MRIEEFLQNLGPFLLVLLLLFKGTSGLEKRFPGPKWYFLTTFSLAAVLTFVPLFNLSGGEIILSLNPHFSIGSLVLLVILISPFVAKKDLLEAKDYNFLIGWNIIISLSVFLCYFNIIPYDLYGMGYDFFPVSPIIAGLTMLLIFTATPLAIILLLYTLAFLLHLLPSDNFFDYVTDGFLFFLSLGLALPKLLRKTGFSRDGAEASGG